MIRSKANVFFSPKKKQLYTQHISLCSGGVYMNVLEIIMCVIDVGMDEGE